MNVVVFLFWFSLFLIFWAMIGYPVSLLILNKLVKHKRIATSDSYFPTVTLMVVAHNEEKVIKEKLDNISKLIYPEDKLQVIISSDNSTDLTNHIVEEYIKNSENDNYKLFKVQERKGKTNAQNEAQKFVDSEILVMTDANSMLKDNCILELVKNFNDPSIAYVTGRLEYFNKDISTTSNSEDSYWGIDLTMRKIESDIQSITAGNGALYAVRNDLYFDIPLINCHDSYFPRYFSTHGYRCIFEDNAVVYEKAGENNKDEYKRKVRMNRTILKDSFNYWKYLNVFKYGWYSYFYFGHRKCRYLLWLNHIILLITNILLAIQIEMYKYTLIFHLSVYLLGIIGMLFHKLKIFNFISYYLMTVIAQIHGAYNCIVGNAKPFWEKAESTR